MSSISFNLQAPRPVRRLLLLLLAVLIFTVLSFLLEPRRRSLNCRSFWSCVSGRPAYTTEVPEDQQFNVAETTLSDGTVRFNRKLREGSQSILFLVLTRDGASWSRDFQSTRRSIYDFLDLLASTKLEAQDISLGLLTASRGEYDLLKTATDEIPLGRVTVFHRNDTGASFDYADRHRPDVQDERRAAVARTRNYLMTRALLDETHVVWVDADVVEFSSGIVQTMLHHAATNAAAGVITARCEQNQMDNYDKNAWALGPDSKLLTTADFASSRPEMKDELARSKKLVPELVKDTVDGELVPLDSVGGTLLYLRADLVRQGLVFPWWSVVGTGWTSDGWVGLETEGLCHLSKRMDGGGCFVLGGTHKTRHTDWG